MKMQSGTPAWMGNLWTRLFWGAHAQCTPRIWGAHAHQGSGEPKPNAHPMHTKDLVMGMETNSCCNGSGELNAHRRNMCGQHQQHVRTTWIKQQQLCTPMRSTGEPNAHPGNMCGQTRSSCLSKSFRGQVFFPKTCMNHEQLRFVPQRRKSVNDATSSANAVGYS